MKNTARCQVHVAVVVWDWEEEERKNEHVCQERDEIHDRGSRFRMRLEEIRMMKEQKNCLHGALSKSMLSLSPWKEDL
jgi:hypothetical protein